MEAPIIIDNKVGTIRGYAQGDVLFLAVRADTPQHGPFTSAFKLSGSVQLMYFYSVMLNLEMQFFSLIAARGQRSGFTMLADLGGEIGSEAHSPSRGRPSPEGSHGHPSRYRNGSPGPGPGEARRHGPTHGLRPHERRAALFQGELSSFRTESSGGRAGVEIRCKFDEQSLRYRVFFSVLNFQTRVSARFDMNVGEIRAFKVLAETALESLERLELFLLDDPNTLTATLSTEGGALELGIRTPYTHKCIGFRDANNLATLSFWCERALAHRGNPQIAFKRDQLGLSLWEHPQTMLPYMRFYLGGDEEILNLTRLNLCAIKLFSDRALRRTVHRALEPAKAPEPVLTIDQNRGPADATAGVV